MHQVVKTAHSGQCGVQRGLISGEERPWRRFGAALEMCPESSNTPACAGRLQFDDLEWLRRKLCESAVVGIGNHVAWESALKQPAQQR